MPSEHDSSRAWVSYSDPNELARNAHFVLPPNIPQHLTAGLPEPSEIEAQFAKARKDLEVKTREHEDRLKMQHQVEANQLKQFAESEKTRLSGLLANVLGQAKSREQQAREKYDQQMLNTPGHQFRLAIDQERPKLEREVVCINQVVEAQRQALGEQLARLEEDTSWQERQLFEKYSQHILVLQEGYTQQLLAMDEQAKVAITEHNKRKQQEDIIWRKYEQQKANYEEHLKWCEGMIKGKA